jgi:secreted PhoX family phosphatase
MSVHIPPPLRTSDCLSPRVAAAAVLTGANSKGERRPKQAQRPVLEECEQSCKQVRTREFPLTLSNCSAGSTSWGSLVRAQYRP